jgi:hypothetical protein
MKMTREELLNSLTDPKLSGRWIKARPHILEALIEHTPKCDTTNTMERVYWLVNDMHDYLKCKGCGTDITSFRSSTEGYRSSTYCCMPCAKKSIESQERSKKTCLERYGVEYPTQAKVVQDKTKNTCLARYGVEYANQAKVNSDKILATMLERYGACYPQWHPKYKDFTLPSGKVVKIQGYEHHALKKLLETYAEEDLDVGCKTIKAVPYFFDGKDRKYYPDIYVKSCNLIIEVKSEYTLKFKKEQTLEKIRATKLLGFVAQLWVYDKKLVLSIH